jgi:hypothetical protein
MADVALYLRHHYLEKEGEIMKLRILLADSFLAGALLVNPAGSFASDTFENSTNINGDVNEEGLEEATDESASQESPDQSLELAAIDYCYRGSAVDPTTGESVDLYTLCTDEAVEGNMDLA